MTAGADARHLEPYGADDALIAAVQQQQRALWRVYTLERTVVVLGRGSTPEREVNLAACERDGVPLLRRRGGGCAVVIDPGNVIVSVGQPLAGIAGNLCQLHRLSDWLATGLARLGAVGVERQGICDLVQGARKISGACLYRARGLLYYSATVLVDARLELIARYLLHPPREPDYRGGRGHQDFVGRLQLTRALAAPQVAAALAEQLLPLPQVGCEAVDVGR